MSTSPRILIIDDSDIARSSMRAVLRSAGMEVFEQPSAIGATRAIQRHGIDAVLVDVTMPGMRGDRLVALLRNNPRLEGLAIVLVSGKTEEELERLAAESGADAVVSKCNVDKELVGVLLKLLGGSAPKRATGQVE